MKKMLVVAFAVVLGTGLAAAQNSNQGTVNSMSSDPQQNQKMTGSMGTTTGQPNEVTPGSAGNPNGGVPMTQTMTGSDSNGDLNQKPASGRSQKNSATGMQTGAHGSGSATPGAKHSHKKDTGTGSNPSTAGSSARPQQ